MVEVNWTLQSKDDLQNIYDYISKDSEVYAIRQIERIIEATFILSKSPNTGRKVPEYNESTIRELIDGNYRILYRIISPQRIDIITVHHGARLLE